ncbi:restriction endonuclease subunit S [Streptomyces griseus]|uniref:restriction endonuclease subunit S n=1 Tax=Streptomyces griseus TaxID=1911 RepID=UPI0033FCBB53
MTVVPNGWMLYTPHDIAGLAKDALVIGPFGSNLKTIDYCDEGVPLVFVKDIRAEDFSRPRAYVSTAKAAELEAHQVLPGDILITKMGDPPGDVALYDSDVPGIITADCIRLRPTAGFDRRYLVHSLRTPNARRQIDAITTGAAQKKVSLDRFRTRLHISAPSLAEQKRIAAVLDQVETLRAKRREAIALLDNLAESIFFNVFGDLVAVTKNVPLSSVANIASGITKGRKEPCGELQSVPYLAVANVQDRELNLSTVKEIFVSVTELERFKLRPEDLLLTEGGDPDKLGRGTLWREELPVCIHQNHVFRVRVMDREEIDPVYLNWVMSSSYGKSYFLRTAKQTTGIASINKTQLGAFPLPVSPIVRQREFRSRIERVQAHQQAHRAHLATLDELFTSLQHRAFSGTLWDHEALGEAA